MRERPLLLTGYDAKRCARRIHNEWDAVLETVEWQVPPGLQMRFAMGVAFEESVFDTIRHSLPGSRFVDLSRLRGKDTIIAATVAAMSAEVELVLGGWLPDDIEGGRTGRPDILLHQGEGTYLPGDVKAHQVVVRRAKGTLTYSLLPAPTTRLTTAGRAGCTTNRIDDYLQIAHYWRMLEAIGRAPATSPAGFIIGSDKLPDIAGTDPVLTWLDLTAPHFQTYSRSRGTAKRSAMERYDHEQGFRLRVAANAATGSPALVLPIFTEECDACPWYDHCRSITGADVASAQITSGRLNVREWHALATAGVVDVEQLATLDVTDPNFQSAYLPEVTNIKDAIGRLTTAVRRAQMIRDDVTLAREGTGMVVVPRADIEIDVDIEWDPADQVYLWGALVSRPGQQAAYHPFVSWDELDAAAAGALARRFAEWLRQQIAAADAAGQTLLVYHYSHPEPTYLTRLIGEVESADLLARFVDLLPIIRQNYFGLHGLGVKKVAPAFGFNWRDEDPGGLQSQLWLLDARHSAETVGRESGQQRILTYNEDDVRATAAIRNGLGSQLGDV